MNNVILLLFLWFSKTAAITTYLHFCLCNFHFLAKRPFPLVSITLPSVYWQMVLRFKWVEKWGKRMVDLMRSLDGDEPGWERVQVLRSLDFLGFIWRRRDFGILCTVRAFYLFICLFPKNFLCPRLILIFLKIRFFSFFNHIFH